MMLQEKKIVIGITGSIAAYKTPLLVRLLKKEGAEVKVMMTPAATDFVTPLTLSTLSENPVLIDPFNPDDGSWNSHVELGRWADLYVLAPVSANTMAKMAAGIADNFFLTAYLSAKCPVLFAPAMDLDMFNHPATQKNINTLVETGNILIDPAVGELASGLSGPGRMEEPEGIFDIITNQLKKKLDFKGIRVMISAGPTYEAIDPVRFIGNYSSGLMGISIADEIAERGGEVSLICGPTHLKTRSASIKRIDVSSAEEMLAACSASFQYAEIGIMSAAVADFKPAEKSQEKIKKSGSPLHIDLQPTTDILATLGKSKKPHQFLVGFALETNNEIQNALKKLQGKNLDMIVLNSLKDEGAGFGTATNKITLINRKEDLFEYDLKTKAEVAKDIADFIVSNLHS